MPHGSNLWSMLTAGLALGLGVLGVFFVFAPTPASSLFGIEAPAHADLAYVRAVGFRDIALCLAILVVLPMSKPATRRLLAASALIPACDIALVLLESGPSPILPLLLHAASGAVLLTLSILGPPDGLPPRH
jgi:nitric oxide reductase large subunit